MTCAGSLHCLISSMNALSGVPTFPCGMTLGGLNSGRTLSSLHGIQCGVLAEVLGVESIGRTL